MAFLYLINPQYACAEGYGTWSVCVSVCPVPHAGRYLGLRCSLGSILNMAFSALFKSYGVKKDQQANKYLLSATSYGADGATFRQKFRRQDLFWFFQSLTAGYKLPGIVRQRATSLTAVQLVQGFFAFAVYFPLHVR